MSKPVAGPRYGVSVGLVALSLLLYTRPSEAQTGLAAPDQTCESRETRIEVHANGAIRAAAVGDSSDPAGTGSLGIGVKWGAKNLFAGVNVASSADTVIAGHGAFILSPAAGKSLKSGVVDLHQKCGLFARMARILLRDNSGLHIYLSAAETIWRHEDQALPVGVFAAGSLLFKDIANGTVGDEAENKVRVKIELGPSIRILTGTAKDDETRDIREAILGSRSTIFGGLEAGLQLQYGVVTGALQFYWYDDFWKEARASGVTGGQLVAFVGVGGPIFSGKLNGR